MRKEELKNAHGNSDLFCGGLARSKIIILVMWAVVMDTVFGVVRSIKERKFNSCFGINGAIRKVAMVTSIIFLAAVDIIMHVNLIGFIPEEIRAYFPKSIAYEVVSIHFI